MQGVDASSAHRAVSADFVVHDNTTATTPLPTTHFVLFTELDGFWAEASEALLLFPLTAPIRRALLQLMHTVPATGSDQVCARTV